MGSPRRPQFYLRNLTGTRTSSSTLRTPLALQVNAEEIGHAEMTSQADSLQSSVTG